MKFNRLITGVAILCTVAALACGSANARQIDESEAGRIAAKFSKNNITRRNAPLRNGEPTAIVPELQKKFLSAKGTPALYIFDVNGGFVVVAGNDDVRAEVLGYGDSPIDVENMPPAMEWWIDQYVIQADYAAVSAQHDGVSKVQRKVTETNPSLPESVDPLLGYLAWNQGAPYNDDCPEIGGKRCYTGCVATSTAQIMRYHSWPKQGSGTWSYTWTGTTPSRTFTTDFSTHTYDWSLMSLHYDSSSTPDQNAAVAQLMNDVGVAVSMDYGTDESGAASTATVPALIDNFGYDNSAKFLFRSIYGIELWEEVIRQELAAGRPVIYAGQSDEGGHQFVCDGYDADGYFHINWGWAGMCNGYFLTTALVPNGVGAGGFAAGYDYNQSIIVGIQPNRGSDAAHNATLIGEYFASQDGYHYGLEAYMMTFIAAQQMFDIGLTFVNNNYPVVNENATYTAQAGVTVNPTAIQRDGTQIPENVLFQNMITVDPVSTMNLADGTYYVYPVAKPSSATEWTIIPTKQYQYVEITITNGQVSVAQPQEAQAELVSVNIPSTVPVNKEFEISGEIRALGQEFYNTVTAVMLDAAGDTIAVSGGDLIDVPAGRTAPFSFGFSTGSSVSPGTYYIQLLIAGQDEGSPEEVSVESLAVELDEQNFPDANFRAAVASAFDSDNDGRLSDAELAKAVELNAMNRNIANSDGLDHLYALRALYLDGNELASVDVSPLSELAVLGLEANQLTAIDVSKNVKLELLRITYNHIEDVDVSNNTMLSQLLVADNPILAIDLSGVESLQTFLSGSTADVNVDSGDRFNLASVPGMDVSRISNVNGGKLEGNYLLFDTPAVSYDYATGNPQLPPLKVTLNAENMSGIGAITVDGSDAVVRYYNLSGQPVDALTPGIYVERNGSSSRLVLK